MAFMRKREDGSIEITTPQGSGKAPSEKVNKTCRLTLKSAKTSILVTFLFMPF